MKPKLEIDIAKVQALAERGLTMDQIAAALGISARTLYSRKAEVQQLQSPLKGAGERISELEGE